MIIDTLITKIKELKAPIVVGLDPTEEIMPSFLKDEYYQKLGNIPEALAEVYLIFNKEIIDKIHNLVPAIKLQIAMYEYLGIPGLEAYIKTINYAKEKGLIVIGDIKRGDITTSAKAYADAHLGLAYTKGLGNTIFDHDMVTIAPYMGSDSITPFIDNAISFDKGLFVLAKTSNPSSSQLQDLKCQDKYLYEHTASLINDLGKNTIGKYGYSSVGAVVGATNITHAMTLRKLMPSVFFLVPGYGAQGGLGKDLKPLFDINNYGAIINSSRGIMAAYLNSNYKQEDFAIAAKDAVLAMKGDLLL